MGMVTGYARSTGRPLCSLTFHQPRQCVKGRDLCRQCMSAEDGRKGIGNQQSQQHVTQGPGCRRP